MVKTCFYGAEVLPGKPLPFVPPPDEARLHLSQASLSVAAAPGTKVALKCRVAEGSELQICVLKEGVCENANLDLLIDHYCEFTVEGDAPVHILGYLLPDEEPMGPGGDDDSEEEDEEGGGYMPMGGPGGMQFVGMDGLPFMLAGGEEEDDEDYKDDDEEESGSEDDDEDDDDEYDSEVADDSGEDEQTRQKHTIIQEIDTDEEDEQVEAVAKTAQKQQAKKAAAAAAAAVAGKGGKPATPAATAGKRKGAEPVVDTPASSKKQKGAEPKQQQQQQVAKEEKKKAKSPAPQQQQQQQANGAAAREVPVAKKGASGSKVRRYENGFAVEDVLMGQPDGKVAKPGKRVTVRYVGRLKSSGKVFDATKNNATFAFRLGVGEVIKGWDKGVDGMRVGDKRRLTVPPQMAYGTQGVRGAIPPNATLEFDVELVNVK